MIHLHAAVDVIEVSDLQGTVKLVERIRAGEARAEEELVQRYCRGVSFMILEHGGQAALEDLRQDTFRLALEKIRRGDVHKPERLSGFMCGLARNLTLDYVRRIKAHPETDIEPATQLADPAPSQLDHLLQKEKAQLVRQVLQKLRNPRDRQALFRFYLAEEDKEQICADLGLTSFQFNQVSARYASKTVSLNLTMELEASLLASCPARKGKSLVFFRRVNVCTSPRLAMEMTAQYDSTS